MPPITAPAYSMGMELAIEFKDQANATSTPPRATTMRGPNLSTNQPSTGTSQVSARTKKLKAPPMAALLQPCVLDMGSTKKLQPYCRLAIITMQATPMISWVYWPLPASLLELSIVNIPDEDCGRLGLRRSLNVRCLGRSGKPWRSFAGD